MMHFRYSFATACLAALVVGCSSPSGQSASNTQPAARSGVPAASNPPSAQSPSSGPSASVPPVANDAAKTPEVKTPGVTNPVTPSSPGPSSDATTGGNPALWHPSKASPIEVAAATDEMLKSLRNVKATIEYAMSAPSGDAKGQLTEKIGDSRNFSLQFPVLSQDKRYGVVPAMSYARANGKVLSERTGDNEQRRPVGTPGTPPSNLPDGWPLVGSRDVFAGLLDGRKPFSDYVKTLADPKNGYNTTVRERSLAYHGQTVRQYEIRATKIKGDANVNGASSVSLIIDAKLHLPLTLIVKVQQPGKTRINALSWDAQWLNNVKFDPKEFQPLPPPPRKV